MIKDLNKKISLCLIIMLALSDGGYANTLKLSDVLSSTEKHFPKILIARQEINIAKLNIINAESSFDDRLENTTMSTPKGGYENFYNSSVWAIPIQSNGAEIFVKYRNGHGNWPIYDKNYLTNSLGEASITLSLPLLRNSTIDDERAVLKISHLDLSNKKFNLQTKKNKILFESGMAYWYWVAQSNSLALSKKLLDLSIVRQNALKKKKRLGDSADIELIENRRFILQRQSNVVNNQLEVTKASRNLSLYYRNTQGKPLSVKDKSAPRYKQLPTVPRIIPVAKVMSMHPDLLSLQNSMDKQNIKIRQSENLLKPILDLSLSLKKQYGDDGDPLLKESAYNVGFNFVVPLGFRKAKTEYHANKIIRSQIMADYNLKTQSISIEIRNLYNDLTARKKQINILTEEVMLAHKIEAAEGIKFREGDSSLFLLNQREQTTFALELKLLSDTVVYQTLKLKLMSFCNFESHCMKHYKIGPVAKILSGKTAQ